MSDAILSPPACEPDASAAGLLVRLDALRGELVELAFTMDRRGRIDAADVASSTAARLGELCVEFDRAAGVGSLVTAPRR